MCGYMRGSLLAMLGGKCRRCGWVRVVYFWSNFLVKIFGQKFDQKYFPPTFFPESFMIHQRAGWIEDIKLHIDNFCIVWYISIFLLTVAVYYAYTAGLEVWDLRNFLWFRGLIFENIFSTLCMNVCVVCHVHMTCTYRYVCMHDFTCLMRAIVCGEIDLCWNWNTHILCTYVKIDIYWFLIYSGVHVTTSISPVIYYCTWHRSVAKVSKHVRVCK